MMSGRWKHLLLTASFLQFFLVPHVSNAQPPDLQRSLQSGLSVRCPSPDLYSSRRPDPPGAPTPVWVGVGYVDVLEISDADQTFKVDAWLTMSWKDPRLADPSREEAQALCEVDADQLWRPRIQIRNLRDWETREDDITLIDAEGRVTLLQRGVWTIFSDFDLRDFPFDRQELTLVIESLQGVNDVEFHLWNELCEMRDATVASWRFQDLSASVSVEQAKLIKRSVFSMTLPAQRDPSFFARKLIVPVALIVFMAYAIFWISPTQIAPQTGIGATSMLTLVAYQFALSSHLPQISYLTRADFFLLWALVLVFSALVEAIATAGFMNYGKEAAVRKMDRLFRVLYPLAFVLILILAVF